MGLFCILYVSGESCVHTYLNKLFVTKTRLTVSIIIGSGFLPPPIWRYAVRPTFARLVVDTDGLGLVLAVLSLHAYEVGVRGLIEACPECQHVLIGLVYSFYELYMKQRVKAGD